MYKIVDFSTDRLIVLSGGTKLDCFKTRREAREALDAYHKKAVENEDVFHYWNAIVVDQED